MRWKRSGWWKKYRSSIPKLRVHLLPDWETLPYDHFSPHQDLISERLATLHHIRSNASDVVIVPITTALYPLPPVEYLAAYTFFLKRGEKLNVAQLREQMTFAGYNHVQQVLTPGEYCVRGGIIDLFAMGSVLPYRIDLFDDEIETIATFDVDTQRTLYPVPEIRLLPAREFPMDEAGQARFRQNFRDRFEGDPSKSRIYKDVSKGIAPAGIEYYLPLFFDKTATLFDYLPKNATLCLHHDVDEAIATFGKDAASRYNLLRGDPQRPLAGNEGIVSGWGMVIFAVLELLAWQTLSDRKVQLIAMAVIGMFALRTWVYHRRETLRSLDSSDEK